MRITPLDIRKQPFRKSLRGFDPDEVNSFLEMVANDYEGVIRQNGELATEVKNLRERLEQYEKIERTLNETLITAQRATDEAKLNAQKEAELILKDAQIRADRYEDQTRQRVNRLEGEMVSLKTQRESFLARFRSMLRDQLELLESIKGDIVASGEEPDGMGSALRPQEIEIVADQEASPRQDTVVREPHHAEPSPTVGEEESTSAWL
jgi:cell division initiation protein